MKRLLQLGIILFLICISLYGKSQDPKDTLKYQIETIDGNEYIGVILDKTNESVHFKSDKIGEINIPQSEIRKITQIKTTKSTDGTYWFDNPQATRYFWAPNAYNLKKGEGYYQNVWVLFNQTAFGVTNHFSLGLGTMPLFLFSSPATPVWLTAKFSLPVSENKINLGAGALIGSVLGGDSSTGFGILYGIATFGSKDKNLNLGLGWAYADGELARNPTVNISGTIRTSAKGYFMTENYIIGTSDNVVVISMVGGRRMIKHVGLDFGLMMPFSSDINSFIAIPWLGLTIPIENRNK